MANKKVQKTIYTDEAIWGRIRALSKSSGLRVAPIIQRALENICSHPERAGIVILKQGETKDKN